MKIVLFLLAFLPLACSPEDPVEPEQLTEVTLYYLELAPACTMVNVKKHQVTEAMYKSVLGLHEVGDCETFHDLPDINNVWHKGYLMGESKATVMQ